MKTLKKAVCAVLALMMVMSLAACEDSGSKEPDPVNLSTCSMNDLVGYLTAKGYIAEGTTPVDINTTEGYHKDNTGGSVPVVAWADNAKDYGGIWLFWWDMENQTDAYSNYQFASQNSGNLLYGGGAASLATSSLRGAFAIAFAENYADADAVLAAFNALPVN